MHFDSPRIVAKAFALVDTRLRTISSLQDIIVQVYEDGPSADIRTKMESYGWTIKVIKQVEEWDCDGSLGDFEDDNYLYDNDNYDSDFFGEERWTENTKATSFLSSLSLCKKN
jgi:hypothetical protein